MIIGGPNWSIPWNGGGFQESHGDPSITSQPLTSALWGHAWHNHPSPTMAFLFLSLGFSTHFSTQNAGNEGGLDFKKQVVECDSPRSSATPHCCPPRSSSTSSVPALEPGHHPLSTERMKRCFGEKKPKLILEYGRRGPHKILLKDKGREEKTEEKKPQSSRHGVWRMHPQLGHTVALGVTTPGM